MWAQHFGGTVGGYPVFSITVLQGAICMTCTGRVRLGRAAKLRTEILFHNYLRSEGLLSQALLPIRAPVTTSVTAPIHCCFRLSRQGKMLSRIWGHAHSIEQVSTALHLLQHKCAFNAGIYPCARCFIQAARLLVSSHSLTTAARGVQDASSAPSQQSM